MKQQDSRTRRYQRYVLVHKMLAKGLSRRRIGQLWGMSRTTVSAFARAETFPERSVRHHMLSRIDPACPTCSGDGTKGATMPRSCGRNCRARATNSIEGR